MCRQVARRVLSFALLVLCAQLGRAERALAGGDAAGLRPSRAERLLPPGTVAFLSVPDYTATMKKWSQAGFRPVWSNPALRTFFLQLETLLPAGWRPQGFAWPELLELPTGEACLALAPGEAGRPVAIFILACRGREQKLAGFFDRLGAGELGKARPTRTTVGGAEIVGYKSLAYFIKDGLLVATADPRLTEQLARTWLAPDALLSGASWRAVAEQAEMNREAAGPNIRWFVRPREFVGALTRRKESPVVPKIGLGSVCCAGGGCWLAHGRHAAFFRIGVYAPPTGQNAPRPLLSAQTEPHDPPAWVPAAAAGYASYRIDLRRSVAAFGDLYDFVVGEPGVFRETIADVKNEPQGPRVDLDAEWFRQFRSRVVILWGPELRAESAWASCGFAMEIGDAPRVAKAVGRLYGYDPDAKKRQVDGATFYCHEDEDDDDAAPEAAKLPAGSKAPPKRQPDSLAFEGVAHQCLFVGLGRELFASLSAPRKPLAADEDYRRVAAALNLLAAGPVSFRSFSRAGDDFRLLEQCMTPIGLVLPFSGSPYSGPSIFTRPAARKAPLPAACPSHCGPGGWVAQPTPTGCRVVGCVLAPAPPGKSRAAPLATPPSFSRPLANGPALN